jgi:hypothetical protein
MQLIHGGGFNKKELIYFKNKAILFIINSIQKLVQDATIVIPENAVRRTMVMRLTNTLTGLEAVAVYALWNDPGIQNAFVNRDPSFVHETASYFLDKVVFI